MELLLLLPFLNNLLMSAVKWAFDKGLRERATRNWRLRLLLVIFSLVGVISVSILNDNPVDPNTVTELLTALVSIIGVAVASHFSYKAVKLA